MNSDLSNARLSVQSTLMITYGLNKEIPFTTFENREPTQNEILEALKFHYKFGATGAYVKNRYTLESKENAPKSTGIIRRIDDLGRILIPKDIRLFWDKKEGDAMEFFHIEEGILLQKYIPEDEKECQK